MTTEAELRETLRRIDGRGYKAYKDIAGHYRLKDYTLFVDHVQGDPFASPSKVRIRVPRAVAELDADLYENAVRQTALQDFLGRQVARAIRHLSQRRGSGKSGLISIDAGGQEILQRASVVITSQWVEARLYVGLPAAGRRVLGRQAAQMLCEDLPGIARSALLWPNLPRSRATEFVLCCENQEAMRQKLKEMGLVAFIADGAILPRESGASQRPLSPEEAVAFRSPKTLQVTIDLPNPGPGGANQVYGMGIPKGVTLVVGGGYHGKSTLLKALERCVYPHVPGDGREYVVTSSGAVKIRAEDGRRVEQVDISPFISHLPYGRSTTAFSTDDASGSTSQAANIVEALEVGASVLLLDEDTSATNFMVRDARMQALVHKEHEPITPFLERVRELYEQFDVSTILVMGGCGDYFDVADTVIMMRDYLPLEVTGQAREIASSYDTQRRTEAAIPIARNIHRVPLAESFDPSRGRRQVKIDAKALGLILFGSDSIDLSCVEQLVDMSQTRAVGYAIHLATERYMDGRRTLDDVLKALEDFFDREGLDALDPFHRPGRHPGSFARPRRFEIAAAINRLRTLSIQQRSRT